LTLAKTRLQENGGVRSHQVLHLKDKLQIPCEASSHYFWAKWMLLVLGFVSDLARAKGNEVTYKVFELLSLLQVLLPECLTIFGTWLLDIGFNKETQGYH
jgi:hypothetical protein